MFNRRYTEIDALLRSPIPLFTEEKLSFFESFVAELGEVFLRSDQSLRFKAYLRGLLESVGRKNVESIAAAISKNAASKLDLAQALQHFISQSPWDVRRLATAILKQSRPFRVDPDAVWVVHDSTFAKKGNHSVGVHRQLARSIGKKINCQLAVFISQVGPLGYFPLASRLYLPGAWMKGASEEGLNAVPEAFRQHLTKTEIASSLIDELVESGEEVRSIVSDATFSTSNDWLELLSRRQLATRPNDQSQLEIAQQGIDWLKKELGLDHFEGRTWQGLHKHVLLVFAAYYFLTRTQDQSCNTEHGIMTVYSPLTSTYSRE